MNENEKQYFKRRRRPIFRNNCFTWLRVSRRSREVEVAKLNPQNVFLISFKYLKKTQAKPDGTGGESLPSLTHLNNAVCHNIYILLSHAFVPRCGTLALCQLDIISILGFIYILSPSHILFTFQ